MKFFRLIATLFLFILFCNLIGLIPGSYTVTSQIVVTAVFACLVYGLSLVMGFLLTWGEVPGHFSSARDAWVAVAIDGTDRIDQSIGTAHFIGRSAICEYDGRTRDSRVSCSAWRLAADCSLAGCPLRSRLR